ncbi:hypothetical protein C4K20_4243 [Pseudomonas chlororaphis subsp. aurantiaca]|nr:hypothetical protein C4K20_4243 [Pseudomonas chlororaphis subsp. aurantiaca]
MPTIVFATACANCFRVGPTPASPNTRVIRQPRSHLTIGMKIELQ